MVTKARALVGKRGTHKPPMTMYSAALTIHAWTLEHGRPPLASECRTSNGLHHWETYYKTFKSTNFSAGILPMVSALVSGTRMHQCLGWTGTGEQCPRMFPDQGPHIRMCETCRKKNYNDIGEEYAVASIRRTSMYEMGIGRGGWERYDPWIRDVDWGQR